MKICVWRYASLTPKLLGIPCLSYISVFGWLLYMRIWTLLLFVSVLIISGLLAKFGFTLTVFIRKILHHLRGTTVTGRPWWFRYRFRGDIERG